MENGDTIKSYDCNNMVQMDMIPVLLLFNEFKIQWKRKNNSPLYICLAYNDHNWAIDWTYEIYKQLYTMNFDNGGGNGNEWAGGIKGKQMSCTFA